MGNGERTSGTAPGYTRTPMAACTWASGDRMCGADTEHTGRMMGAAASRHVLELGRELASSLSTIVMYKARETCASTPTNSQPQLYKLHTTTYRTLRSPETHARALSRADGHAVCARAGLAAVCEVRARTPTVIVGSLEYLKGT